jgi:hypothetical protein
MAKSDTVKARFKEAIARHKELGKIDYFTPLRRFLGVEIDHAPRKLSWAEVFSVEPGTPLEKAFQYAGLDPSDPYAWKLLLGIFATAHFATDRRSSKQKTRWGAWQYSRLLSDYDQTKDSMKPGTKDRAIAAAMIKKYPHYKEIRKAETLRRRFAPARNPAENEDIKEWAMHIRKLIESQDEFPDLSVEKIKRFANQQAIEVLSRAWKRGRHISH